MRANNLTSNIEYFKEAIDSLQREATEFMSSLKGIDRMNPYAVREVNDKLMNLHRCLVDPQGLLAESFSKIYYHRRVSLIRMLGQYFLVSRTLCTE
ncbi:hypothetical protein EB796_022313 [Bugula neritina]|uniref:Transferrin receptor-like dimerisation domain-containing protein n=1 Tax=Bugula neritina TaxID=10212 RepID=A0A7J7J0U6_BUGNE|nr:hypothetical protein EB796_022313 [Bugula neritina]